MCSPSARVPNHRFSVVIPANDEEALVERCLAFVYDLEPDEAEVVVVANGCTDDTVTRASRVAGVLVVDLPTPGKSEALNAGDLAVSAFPRIYLDADVVVEADALRALVEILTDGPPMVAALRADFVTAGRPLVVRLFYAAHRRLPYLSGAMVGTGLYALNAAGRSRFPFFPALTADDLFVQRHFAAYETIVVDHVSFVVEVPRTARDLVRVRTRIAYGNAQFARTGEADRARSTTDTMRALVALPLRDVRMVPAALVYVAITVMSRISARRRSAGAWQRDVSTRAGAARDGGASADISERSP